MAGLNLTPVPESDIPTGDPEHMTTGPEPVPPGQSVQPLPPPNRPGPKGFQPESIRVGPITVKQQDLITQGTKGQWQKEDQMIDETYAQIERSLNWFHATIEPRLDFLGLGGSQGAAYALPNVFAMMPPNYRMDPAVQTWFSQFGGISTAMNKIYASGRPSALGFQTYTEPHIPTPPKPGWDSAKDAMSTVNFRQYEEYLNNAKDTLELMRGKKPKSYQRLGPEWVPGSTPGYWLNKNTGEWRMVVP